VTQEPRQPASDLIGEVQRWLLRSGARGVSRGLNDQIRTALRGGGHTDVWETATADEEPPECAWCPICRARRRLRESGPGLASHVAAATDAVGVMVQDAMSAFEAAVAAAGRQARPRQESQSGGEAWDMATDEPGTPSLVESSRPPAPPQPAADGPAADAAAPKTADGPPADSAAPKRPADPAADSAAPKSSGGPSARRAAPKSSGGPSARRAAPKSSGGPSARRAAPKTPDGRAAPKTPGGPGDDAPADS
jgi:hypothetical protein